MATANVSAENLELLQQHLIDVRDFNKARARYKVVVELELVPAVGEAEDPEVAAATREAQQRVRAAWAEYVSSVQSFFTRMMGNALQDLEDIEENAKKEAKESEDGLASSSVLARKDSALNAMQSSMASNATSMMSMDVNVPKDILLRADRMNDICLLCDKWYCKHESTIQLLEPTKVAKIAASAVASVSRLYRLLGLKIILLCLGNVEFARSFTENSTAVRWVGLCGDRELNSEVELFLNICDRMLTLMNMDPKAYPRFPFGWLYRITALLSTVTPMDNVPPKWRSMAVAVALLALRRIPGPAMAANLHTTLLQACIAKGFVSNEEMKEIVDMVLALFNEKKTREYMRLTDINVLFAPFLDTHTPVTPDYLIMLNNAKEAIVTVLMSWVGNLWIASETTALRSLIDVLHLPGDIDRRMVIITLFNKLLMRLAPHRGITLMDPWLGMEEEKRRRAVAVAQEEEAAELLGSNSMYSNPSNIGADLSSPSMTSAPRDKDNGSSSDDDDFEDDLIPTTKALGYYVMDPLLGRVLITLLHHGLPLALVAAVQTMGANPIAMRATALLLQDFVVLMDTTLPSVTVRSVHESVNVCVGQLASSGDTFVAALTSQLFHVFKQNSATRENNMEGTAWSSNSNMPATSLVSSTGASLDMDDNMFTNAVNDTKVLSCPTNWQSWNFDLLLVLVQGPLKNIRRLRDSKALLRVLIGFYTPHDNKALFYIRPFSSLRAEEVTRAMCTLGLALFDLLLRTQEGAMIIKNTDFLSALLRVLKEVRGAAPVVLNKGCVNGRVGQTILRLIGGLSAHATGLMLMRENGLIEQIDSLFAKLRGVRVMMPGEKDTLFDVCNQILQYLYIGAVPNYGVCDDLRHTFRAALSNASNAIRLCAATHLKRAMWRDLSTSLQWGIETLVQALSDTFFNVVESAFKILLSVCMSSEEALDCLIELCPTVVMESDAIVKNAKKLRLEELLYCIAGRRKGFLFLHKYGWIGHELSRWEVSESARYALSLRRVQSGEEACVSNASIAINTSFRMHSHSMSMSSTVLNRSWGGSHHNHTAVPLLTESALSGAKFIPPHFAAILARSPEGCEVLKSSLLWTRSVAYILEQPEPPDIVFDDTISDDDDDNSSSDSDTDELNVHSRQDALARQMGSIASPMMPGKSPTVGSTAYAMAAVFPSSVARMDGPLQRDENGNPAQVEPTVMVTNMNSSEEVAKASDLQRLKKGTLSSPALLSAARGYKPVGQSYTMDCVGDLNKLMEAMLVVSLAASTEDGFALLLGVEGLHQRLTALARFSSNLTVRSVGLLSSGFICRSKLGAETLRGEGYNIMNSTSAYTSAEGIPYAVSFAHLKLNKVVSFSRRTAATNTVARNAYADYAGFGQAGVPKQIADHVFALANPVSRENSKKVLYKLMKKHPLEFIDPHVVGLCLDATAVLRLRHEERKFIADLLDKAQTTPLPVTAAPVVVPVVGLPPS